MGCSFRGGHRRLHTFGLWLGFYKFLGSGSCLKRGVGSVSSERAGRLPAVDETRLQGAGCWLAGALDTCRSSPKEL